MKNIDSATRLIATDRAQPALRSTTFAPVSEESRTGSGDRYTPSEQPESPIYSYRDVARFKGGAQDNDARDGQVKDLIATGPGARGEVQRGDHDDATLEDPNAGKKDAGLPGFDLGSVRGHAAESKKNAEELLSIGGDEPASARDRLSGSAGAASGTGLSEGSGGAASDSGVSAGSGGGASGTGFSEGGGGSEQDGGSGVRGAGSNLGFNPIRDAQRGQEGSGEKPGDGGPSAENGASDAAFNKGRKDAVTGWVQGKVTDIGDDYYTTTRGYDGSTSTVIRQEDSVVTVTTDDNKTTVKVDAYDDDGKKTTTTTSNDKNGNGSVTTTTTTQNPDGSSEENKTTTPPAGSSAPSGQKVSGGWTNQPDSDHEFVDHGFVGRSGQSPTGKGQEGGEKDPTEEAAFEVAPGAQLPDRRETLLGGDALEPDFSTEPDGEAPSGSGFNDPGALDPADDEAVVPQTEGRERELGGSYSATPEPSADDDASTTVTVSPLLGKLVASEKTPFDDLTFGRRV